MRNFIQTGDTLTFTSSDPVTSGQGVFLNALFGVAASDAPAGTPFEAAVVGVFELPKAAGAIEAGAKVYWKADTSNVTSTAAGNKLIGAATEAAADAATTVRVRLNGAAV
jgi:predicted RecA/RadA family phage recombinase